MELSLTYRCVPLLKWSKQVAGVILWWMLGLSLLAPPPRWVRVKLTFLQPRPTVALLHPNEAVVLSDSCLRVQEWESHFPFGHKTCVKGGGILRGLTVKLLIVTVVIIIRMGRLWLDVDCIRGAWHWKLTALENFSVFLIDMVLPVIFSLILYCYLFRCFVMSVVFVCNSTHGHLVGQPVGEKAVMYRLQSS